MRAREGLTAADCLSDVMMHKKHDMWWRWGEDGTEADVSLSDVNINHHDAAAAVLNGCVPGCTLIRTSGPLPMPSGVAFVSLGLRRGGGGDGGLELVGGPLLVTEGRAGGHARWDLDRV